MVEAIGDERLRLIRNPGPPGLSASRNAGVAVLRRAGSCSARTTAASRPTTRSFSSARRSPTTPRSRARPGSTWSRASTRSRGSRSCAASAPAEPRIDSHGGVPAETVETPFIPAPALIRRDVFDNVSFDEGYTGNAYRQETAFFVQAVRSGYRCVLTPFTASYQEQPVGGGRGALGAARLRALDAAQQLALPAPARRLAHASRATSPASFASRPPSPPSASPRRCAASSRRGSRGGRHEPHGARRLARRGQHGRGRAHLRPAAPGARGDGIGGSRSSLRPSTRRAGRAAPASSPLWSSRRLMADLPPGDLDDQLVLVRPLGARGAGAHPRLPRHDDRAHDPRRPRPAAARARAARVRLGGRGGRRRARRHSRRGLGERRARGQALVSRGRRRGHPERRRHRRVPPARPRRGARALRARAGAALRALRRAHRGAQGRRPAAAEPARGRATSCSWPAPRRSTAAASSACCRRRRPPGRTPRPTASSSRPATRPAAGSCSRRSPPARRSSRRGWAGWRRSCASSPTTARCAFGRRSDDIAARLASLAGEDHSALTAAARAWMEQNGSYAVFAERWGALAERVFAATTSS